VTIEIAVLCLTPCSLVDMWHCLWGMCCLPSSRQRR